MENIMISYNPHCEYIAVLGVGSLFIGICIYNADLVVKKNSCVWKEIGDNGCVGLLMWGSCSCSTCDCCPP